MLRRGVRALAAPAVRLGAMGVRGGVVAGVRGMSGTGESVARVLAGVENLADAEDLTRWLREGRAGAQGRTVIIKVGGEVVDTGLDELADALSALRAAGASPIVVHGGGPQMNKEIERLGLKPRYEGGHRVTDEATLELAVRVFAEGNEKLVRGLAARGVTAEGFKGTVFESEVADGGRLGLVGEVTGVRLEGVNAALAAGKVPVLNSIGLFSGKSAVPVGGGTARPGGAMNINADVAARQLALALRPSPYKVVFVSAGGGWKEDGAVVPVLDMGRDFARLEARDYTGRQGTLLKLREVKALTDGLPASSSVVICAAGDVAAQLVPQRGPGSQIRRGARVGVFRTPQSFDVAGVDRALSVGGVADSLERLVASYGPNAHLEAVVATDDFGAVAVVVSVDAVGEHDHADHNHHDHKHGNNNNINNTHTTTTTTNASQDASSSEMWDAEESGIAHPRLAALVVSPAHADTGAEDAVWGALKGEFPSLWWVSTPAAKPLSAASASASASLQPLAYHRASRHAAGVVRLLPPRQLAPGQSGLPPADDPDAIDVEIEVAGGGAPAGQADGLPGSRSLMWWGVESLEDVEAMSEYVTITELMPPPTVTVVSSPSPSSSSTSTTPSTTTSASASSSGGARTRVGLIGARGFTGRELVRLLGAHGKFELVAAGSRALAGQSFLEQIGLDAATARAVAQSGSVDPALRFTSLEPEDILAGKAPQADAWVLAMPNGVCEKYASALRAQGKGTGKEAVILDLSADKRFEAEGSEWVYGLPELPGQRARLLRARSIANPGCYATGSQIALYPLSLRGALDAAIPPHVFGVSGYSGAGTAKSDKNDPERLRDNLLPYALVGHLHEREISRHARARTAFSPHVAPFFQGIHLTGSMHLDAAALAKLAPAVDWDNAKAAADAFHDIYRAFYRDDKLIRVLPNPQMPDVRSHGMLQHGVTVGGFTYDPKVRRLVVVSCIDNLLKGAATQALQNLNLALFGAQHEYHGIPLPPH